MLGRIVVLLVVTVVALGTAACGGDDDSEATDETTMEETTTAGGELTEGRTIFVDSCGSCHTLADAGTSGAIGPDLDGTSHSVEEIEEQVRNGGGGMPAFEGDLTDEEIQAVSEYVAEAGQG